MDLNTIAGIRGAHRREPWRPGDAWLGGGTYLFSEPQPHLRRLVDLIFLITAIGASFFLYNLAGKLFGRDPLPLPEMYQN
ncbi:hypothetical protein ACWDPI_37500, partial [Streptomyces zhihengii]